MSGLLGHAARLQEPREVGSFPQSWNAPARFALTVEYAVQYLDVHDLADWMIRLAEEVATVIYTVISSLDFGDRSAAPKTPHAPLGEPETPPDVPGVRLTNTATFSRRKADSSACSYNRPETANAGHKSWPVGDEKLNELV